MMTRRQFLKASALAGVGILLPVKGGVVIARAAAPSARSFATAAAIPGGTQDPKQITKYAMPLVIPPAMPQRTKAGSQPGVDNYKIAVRQFQQQILPEGMPKTTVWSYG